MVRETLLLQFQVDVCACVHLSVGFVQAITSTFMHEFQNNLPQLFSLRRRSAV